MDDYIESSATNVEATKKAQDPVKMLSKGCFTLTKFVSNIPNLPTSLETNVKPATETDEKHSAAGDENSHVLGLKWNHRFD